MSTDPRGNGDGEEDDSGTDLTRSIVDHLSTCRRPETTMAIALALRIPYPAIQDELESLEALGIVIRNPEGRTTTWWLG